MTMLHEMEKEMQTKADEVSKSLKIQSCTSLTHNGLMKLSKDQLANLLTSFVNIFDRNLNVCKAAAAEMDQLKSEQIKNQNELIRIKNNQINSVQETVKNEIKTWADVVNKNNEHGVQISMESVKEAVQSVRIEDDRAKNFMIYGLEEAKEGQEEDLEDAVQATFERLESHKIQFFKVLGE